VAVESGSGIDDEIRLGAVVRDRPKEGRLRPIVHIRSTELSVPLQQTALAASGQSPLGRVGIDWRARVRAPERRVLPSDVCFSALRDK
jgi:hypothetical protein